MKILTVNPGSTATKYTIFSPDGAVKIEKEFEDFSEQREWLSSLAGIEKIGIRLVHGGNTTEPTEVNGELLEKIKKHTVFAPIHNRIAVETIGLLQEIFDNTKIIAMFDTDFHAGMPEYASTYPVNPEWKAKYGIKRYGFHGIALSSVLKQLDTKYNKVIMAHLGGGSTIVAVKDGVSIDTTMGLTPLEGIMMKTRSGSVDPALPFVLAELENRKAEEVYDGLNNNSGFFGITGTKDTKDIIERASRSEEPYKLAFDIYVYQITKQIFAYHGVLGGCDALVFSGGIGHGNEYFRDTVAEKVAMIIDKEKILAIKSDEAKEIFDALT